MYQFDQDPSTNIDPESKVLLEEIRNSEYAVLVGRNNSGKSFLLKEMTVSWGAEVYFIGPMRYQNFNILGQFSPSRNRLQDRWNNTLNTIRQAGHNTDGFPFSLQQGIAELSDIQREKLIEIVYLLLDTKLEIKHTVEGNSMSHQYISCNGHNVSYTSSGFRLILTILTSLLDTGYSVFLIDEPELGISPEAQGIIANFLFDRTQRNKYFSHIKTLIFATHSTIFLDRLRVENNYSVSKSGDTISITRTLNRFEFNKIHFLLLGNRFETLFLPSVIVLVEGKCDHKFVERATALRFPEAQISVIAANSDDQIKYVLNVAGGILSDIQKSPYRDRIFAVLDSTHTKGLPGELVKKGLPLENVIVWPKNGIEYYYPPSLMDRIYGVGPEVEIVKDQISRNGISYDKNTLAEKICAAISADTEHNSEFETLLMKKLAEKIDPNAD